jgi:Ohr subfamily peroxiredoxin
MNKLDKVLYEASAKVKGGRGGRVQADHPELSLKLASPKELGGQGGDGTNPEQLFAAGYSACFASAVSLVASKEKVALSQDVEIEGTVGIGPIEEGFGIKVELKISLPGVEKKIAEELVQKAHRICPYSNATRNNIQVTLTVI